MPTGAYSPGQESVTESMYSTAGSSSGPGHLGIGPRSPTTASRKGTETVILLGTGHSGMWLNHVVVATKEKLIQGAFSALTFSLYAGAYVGIWEQGRIILILTSKSRTTQPNDGLRCFPKSRTHVRRRRSRKRPRRVGRKRRILHGIRPPWPTCATHCLRPRPQMSTFY